MNSILDPNQEISRVEHAIHCFKKLKSLSPSPHGCRIIRNGSVDSKKLILFVDWKVEMWPLRHILRVQKCMGMDRELIEIVKRWKTWAHVTWKILLSKSDDGKKIESKDPDRRQMTWLRNIKEWTGLHLQSLFKKAQDRIKCAEVIANLRSKIEKKNESASTPMFYNWN